MRLKHLYACWPHAGGLATGVIAAMSIAATVAISGCRNGEASIAVPGANADRGRHALAAMGCAACHVIPGVQGADGKVGPPLAGIGSRIMIAGQVPNTPDNLVRWIRDPQAIEPGTAMPNLGVSEQTARDIAAYLYTLQ
jgi:cytochrome c